MNFRIFLCLAFAACSFTLACQTKADEWFEKKEYRQAVRDYKALIKTTERARKPSSEKLLHFYTRLGESYFYLRDYANAENSFVKAKEHGAKGDTFLLSYGQVLLSNGKADSALLLYHQILEQSPENRDVRDAIRKAEFNLAASSSPQAKLNPVTLQSQLNISNNQYALSWYKGALLFSSDRSTPEGGIETAPSHFYYSQPIYDFNRNEINGWAVPKKLKDIETDRAFVHSFAYDEKDSIYYVMQSLIAANAGDPRCNIYAYQTKSNGKIGKPMQQSFHNPDANIGHPTLSSDGQVMIFSSTVAGSSDLYIVKKTGENTWTTPLLLDSTINSVHDEAYPQLFHDSLLFFASNGHLGIGGMDIFYTTIAFENNEHTVSGNSDLKTLKFSTPVNLGAPINSGGDDVAFLLKPDANGGFFISNRTVNGQNKNQIYSFENEPYALNPSGDSNLANPSGNVQMPVLATAFAIPRHTDTDKSKLNAEIARLNEQVFVLNTQVTKLNNEVSKNTSKKWDRPEDTAILKANRLRINAEKDSIIEAINHLNADIANRNAELIKHQARDSNPNDKRSWLDDEIARQNVEITKQNAEIAEQNNRVTQANDDYAEWTDSILGLRRDITEQDREEHENRLAEQSEAAKFYTAPYQKLIYSNDEIIRLDAEIDRLRAEEEEAKRREREKPLTVAFVMPHSVDTDKSKINAEIAKLNAQIFALNAQVAELNEDMAESSNNKMEPNADIKALSANRARLNDEKSKLDEEILRLYADIANYNAELNKLNTKEPKSNTERSLLDDEIALKNAEITKQNVEITKQNNRVAQLNNDLDILIETLLGMNKEITDLESEADQLSTQSPENAAERARLEAERQRIMAAIEKLREEREQLNKERDEFNAEKAKIADVYAKQHQGLVDANDELARLNAEIDRLNAEIARLRAENAAGPDTVYIDRIVEVPVEVFVEKAVQGEAILMKNIYFDINSTELKPESKAELDRFANAMKASPNARFEISGHTDNTGSLELNQTLSEARAKAVCDYLIEHGVRAGRLTGIGYNYARPIATNDTPEGRAMNRRIEVSVL